MDAIANAEALLLNPLRLMPYTLSKSSDPFLDTDLSFEHASLIDESREFVDFVHVLYKVGLFEGEMTTRELELLRLEADAFETAVVNAASVNRSCTLGPLSKRKSCNGTLDPDDKRRRPEVVDLDDVELATTGTYVGRIFKALDVPLPARPAVYPDVDFDNFEELDSVLANRELANEDRSLKKDALLFVRHKLKLLTSQQGLTYSAVWLAEAATAWIVIPKFASWLSSSLLTVFIGDAKVIEYLLNGSKLKKDLDNATDKFVTTLATKLTHRALNADGIWDAMNMRGSVLRKQLKELDASLGHSASFTVTPKMTEAVVDKLYRGDQSSTSFEQGGAQRLLDGLPNLAAPELINNAMTETLAEYQNHPQQREILKVALLNRLDGVEETQQALYEKLDQVVNAEGSPHANTGLSWMIRARRFLTFGTHQREILEVSKVILPLTLTTWISTRQYRRWMTTETCKEYAAFLNRLPDTNPTPTIHKVKDNMDACNKLLLLSNIDRGMTVANALVVYNQHQTRIDNVYRAAEGAVNLFNKETLQPGVWQLMLNNGFEQGDWPVNGSSPLYPLSGNDINDEIQQLRLARMRARRTSVLIRRLKNESDPLRQQVQAAFGGSICVPTNAELQRANNIVNPPPPPPPGGAGGGRGNGRGGGGGGNGRGGGGPAPGEGRNPRPNTSPARRTPAEVVDLLDNRRGGWMNRLRNLGLRETSSVDEIVDAFLASKLHTPW